MLQTYDHHSALCLLRTLARLVCAVKEKALLNDTLSAFFARFSPAMDAFLQTFLKHITEATGITIDIRLISGFMVRTFRLPWYPQKPEYGPERLKVESAFRNACSTMIKQIFKALKENEPSVVTPAMLCAYMDAYVDWEQLQSADAAAARKKRAEAV